MNGQNGRKKQNGITESKRKGINTKIIKLMKKEEMTEGEAA